MRHRQELREILAKGSHRFGQVLARVFAEVICLRILANQQCQPNLLEPFS